MTEMDDSSMGDYHIMMIDIPNRYLWISMDGLFRRDILLNVSMDGSSIASQLTTWDGHRDDPMDCSFQRMMISSDIMGYSSGFEWTVNWIVDDSFHIHELMISFFISFISGLPMDC